MGAEPRDSQGASHEAEHEGSKPLTQHHCLFTLFVHLYPKGDSSRHGDAGECTRFSFTERLPSVTFVFAQVTGQPPKKGTPVLAMLAGFADDHGTWSMIAPRFEATHTVVSMVMPDYDTKELHNYWGYTLPNVVDMLEESMKEVVPEGDKATLMIHDWGAAIGLMYLRRESALKRVDRLVLMDIGPKSPPQAMALLYQLYLASAFLVSRFTLNIFGNEAASNVQANHHGVLCASMLPFSTTNDDLHDDMTL